MIHRISYKNIYYAKAMTRKFRNRGSLTQLHRTVTSTALSVQSIFRAHILKINVKQTPKYSNLLTQFDENNTFTDRPDVYSFEEIKIRVTPFVSTPDPR